MTKKIKYPILFILLVCLLFTLIYPEIIIKDVITSMHTFIYKLFPSMFFFYTLTDLLINYNFVFYSEILFNKLFKKIFHINGRGSFIVIMSMLSGFPSGPKYIIESLEKGIISINNANYLLTFTHFSNPIFILGVCSNIYGKKYGFIILIIHYLSNFILAFIIRPKKIEMAENNIKIKHYSFDIALKESFYKSFKVLMLIFGNTIFFFCISDIISYKINNPLIKTIIYGLFDLTKGIISVNKLNISNYFKLLLLVSFISLGGININFQVKQLIAQKKLEYRYFLLGRISSLAISIVLLSCCMAIGII